MSLEPINRAISPLRSGTHRSSSRLDGGWSSSARNPKTNEATSLVPAIWPSKPTRSLSTSVAPLLLPVPGPSESPRSRSSSLATGARTYRPSKRRGWRFSGITSRRTQSWAWRRSPDRIPDEVEGSQSSTTEDADVLRFRRELLDQPPPHRCGRSVAVDTTNVCLGSRCDSRRTRDFFARTPTRRACSCATSSGLRASMRARG